MEWVAISTDEMERARKARGLSYERIARQFPFSGKTIERWVKAGRVPRQWVEQLAEIIGLGHLALAPARRQEGSAQAHR